MNSGQLPAKSSLQFNGLLDTDAEERLDGFRRLMNDALAASMKRLLVVNDMYGDRALREAILNEINGLNRLLNLRFDDLCLKE